MPEKTIKCYITFNTSVIQYIAYDFILNLRVFRTRIENLKQQIRRDSIQVTYGKFVTSLVQQDIRKKTDL